MLGTEHVVNPPELPAQCLVIGRSLHCGPEPLCQAEHPVPSVILAGQLGTPCLKCRRTGGFYLLTRRLPRPGSPEQGVPPTPLIDPDLALLGEVAEFPDLVKQADRPAEQLADLITAQRVQVVWAFILSHCLNSRIRSTATTWTGHGRRAGSTPGLRSGNVVLLPAWRQFLQADQHI